MSGPLPAVPAEMLDGSSAADAYAAMQEVLRWSVLEVARLSWEEMPGLLEALETDVVLVLGGTTRSAWGWLAPDSWQLDTAAGPRPVDEIFINAAGRSDPAAAASESVSASEQILVTLVHEQVHLWNKLSGVRDNSNRGRYHNRHFARAAHAAHLQVQPDPVHGHRTPALRPSGTLRYAEILTELDRVLILTRPGRRRRPAPTSAPTVEPTVGASTVAPAKYVSARCGCQDRPRTLRMAWGSWIQGPVLCGRCGAPFTRA